MVENEETDFFLKRPTFRVGFNSPQENLSRTSHETILKEQYTWGADELHSLSKKPNNWLGGLGTTIIDSLSTIHLFADDALFSSAREFIANDLEFDRPRCGSRFEITIRILGGLLSAFDLTGDEIFLRKAEEIGTEIIEGFQDEWIVSPEMEMCFGLNTEPSEEDSFWDDYTEEDEATEKKKCRYKSMSINNYENKKKDHRDPLIPNGSITLANACPFMQLAALGDRVWMMANIDAMVDHIVDGARNSTTTTTNPRGWLRLIRNWSGRTSVVQQKQYHPFYSPFSSPFRPKTGYSHPIHQSPVRPRKLDGMRCCHNRGIGSGAPVRLKGLPRTILPPSVLPAFEQLGLPHSTH
ncbi:putative Mannosyl-oligosaccharide 1,2-alpha-mannosidase MNS2 [Blattamonas nauphoetae]|uniref:alpha-1,2-Mannosidase n=1 Tax=Blattamonas nauphoetae TaxID=2049346 RepID=A0ABQ9XKV3_9EUKA|nr:putative Mannosyl-oligosaccharide 1,2-alpha-mannosidase MNS2 [Blattamonas nauphoetae]